MLKKKALLFCVVLLTGIVLISGALASQEIQFDSTASMKLADSFVFDRTQNNITYYKDAKNKVSCGFRVSDGQVAMKDVKATLKKAGYTDVGTKKVNGIQICSGTKDSNNLRTLMTYFNTKGGHFVMLAFTYDPAKAQGKKKVDAAIASLKMKEAVPDPEAPVFSWTGVNDAKVSSAKYGGKDLIMIYFYYTDDHEYITYYLDQIKPSMSKLKEKKVKVLACMLGAAGKNAPASLSKKYPSMVFGWVADEQDPGNDLWTALDRLGYTKNSIKYPVVILRSRNNRLRWYQAGSIDNAETVVKKAIAMADDDVPAVPPDPDEIPDTDDTITIGNGKYRISGKSAIFTGVVKSSVKELQIPQVIIMDNVKYPVTKIADNACKGLKKLKSVMISSNVKKIGKSAFQDCAKLKTIVFMTTKLKQSSIGSKAFSGIADKPVIKCTAAVKKNYKKWLTKRGVPKNASYQTIIIK